MKQTRTLTLQELALRSQRRRKICYNAEQKRMIVECYLVDKMPAKTLWTAAEGTVNYPCDNHAFDHLGLRRIPNLIVVR